MCCALRAICPASMVRRCCLVSCCWGWAVRWSPQQPAASNSMLHLSSWRRPAVLHMLLPVLCLLAVATLLYRGQLLSLPVYTRHSQIDSCFMNNVLQKTRFSPAANCKILELSVLLAPYAKALCVPYDHNQHYCFQHAHLCYQLTHWFHSEVYNSPSGPVLSRILLFPPLVSLSEEHRPLEHLINRLRPSSVCAFQHSPISTRFSATNIPTPTDLSLPAAI